jgi:hypothetical protein
MLSSEIFDIIIGQLICGVWGNGNNNNWINFYGHTGMLKNLSLCTMRLNFCRALDKYSGVNEPIEESIDNQMDEIFDTIPLLNCVNCDDKAYFHNQII